VAKTPLDAEVRRAYLAPYNNWDNRLAVLRFVQDIPMTPDEPSYDVVSQVDRDLVKLKNIPMCICWGMQDFVFTPGFLEQWRARFPDADVHTFHDAGHYLLEDAADDVIAIIQSFLQQQTNKT
jgi:haloalkane dehalogenase